MNEFQKRAFWTGYNEVIKRAGADYKSQRDKALSGMDRATPDRALSRWDL